MSGENDTTTCPNCFVVRHFSIPKCTCTPEPTVSPAPAQEVTPISDEQIKHMVNRFLMWRLPENFNPDGGISFEAMRNEHTQWPAKNEPVGTNLFDAHQAEQMVRYIVGDIPKPSESAVSLKLVDELGFEVSTDDNPRDVLIRDSDSTEWTSGMAWARNSPETILTMLRDLWRKESALASDYQSLSAELERVKQERDALKQQRTTLIAAVDDWNERAEAAERSNTALRGALEKVCDFAPRCSQLLDGWHMDGTAWSEWDESVRRELTEIHAKAIAALQVEGDTK